MQPACTSPSDVVRSVKDFSKDSSLVEGLMVGLPCEQPDSAAVASAQHVRDRMDTCGPVVQKKLKTEPVWALTDIDVDPLNFEVNTLSHEFNRLQVLKSFCILDECKDDALDTLTGMGCRMFDTPVCLVSLVDLDRLWFVSNRGFGDAREILRENSLCSYCIMSKMDMIVVPDTTKDERFMRSPVVTGGAKVRFYAGAALVCPDGYRIGNYCIIDFKPRPQGLSEKEQATLKDFATTTMRIMVDRRDKLLAREQREKLIASTAHDLMTPLTGLQLSLSLLKVETEANNLLSTHEAELIETAERCSELMARICETSFSELREDTSSSTLIGKFPVTEGRLSELVSCLHKIMGPISKNVPLIIAIGDTPPDLLVKNDLKVFRCALSFVSTACSRTETGSVRLDICVRDGRLVFECKDSAPAVSASDSANLFKSEQTESMIAPTLAGLHLAAYMLSSMEGEYGFQPYSYDFNDDELLHSGDCRKTGSLFWFSVPIGAQLSNEDVVMSDPPRPGGPVEAATTKIPLFPTSIVGYQQKLVPSLTAEGHDDSLQLNASSSSVSRMSTEIARDRDLPLGACTLDRMGLKSNMKTIPRIVSGTPARQRKALVIDDSLVVRKTLGRALSTMGYECTLAENGMEGLKELQATIFDLSLCDFLMPVMDGLDCVKQYREWERANRPRFRQHIVGISAHASGNDQFVGLKLGLDDFKAKPVAIKTLKELSESKAVSLISQRLDSLALAHALGDTDKTSISSQPSSSIGSEPPVPVCLVASSDFKDSMAKVFESNGWTCAIARDCGSAMKLLKMRNWDAVLLDEGLLPTSASNCAREFRQWEAENRVNRQNNMFMLCSMCETSSDGSVVVQAPWGFDGALSRQMCWNDFETLVQKNSNNIITR